MPYITATTSKLFAASGTAFYDATAQGVVGASVVSGLTNARWQSANMGTPGGQFFYAVNGVDKPQYYDNAAWVAVDGGTVPAITGVTTTLLIHVNVYKNRLYFVETASMRAWYLPLNSIGGAAGSLDFSSIFKLGGFLMAMCTWTVDNAAGINEYAVFITSEGEVAVYQGADPSNAATWLIVGVFRIGRPVGRRCFEKMGSDIIVITSDGVFPLSKALLTDRSQLQDALSAKIINLINNDVASYSGNFGWDIKLYPLGNKVVVNVPQRPGVTQYQYVMNTITGAWCRFTKWNANCWQVKGDVLYFGGNLGAGVFVTLNPADKGADVTLSNANLTATITIAGAVRATRSVSSGKWYWEVTAGGVGLSTSYFGIAKAAMALNNYIGSDANGWGWSPATLAHSGILTAYGALFSGGDVIGIALDADGGALTFYKNGVSQGVAFTGLSGTFYPAVSNGGSSTSNFGGSAFAYSAPTGYSAIGATAGYVAKADTGFSDNGNYIFGEVKTAFQYFDAPGTLKRWTMARPVFLTAGNLSPAIRMDVDFEDVVPTSTGSFSNTGGTAWDTALWNTFPWGSSVSIKKDWQSVSGVGDAGALHMRIVNNATSVSWMSVNYVYEQGGIL
jgi:hypothetical protein